MILADTSIWVEFLRGGNSELQQRLSVGQVAMHPFIVTEIALGSLHDRRSGLDQMDALYRVQVAGTGEVRHMIEARQLYARGLGFVDVHLLISCLLTPGLQLWTRDSRMEKAAVSMGIAVHRPATP